MKSRMSRSPARDGGRLGAARQHQVCDTLLDVLRSAVAIGIEFSEILCFNFLGRQRSEDRGWRSVAVDVNADRKVCNSIANV